MRANLDALTTCLRAVDHRRKRPTDQVALLVGELVHTGELHPQLVDDLDDRPDPFADLEEARHRLGGIADHRELLVVFLKEFLGPAQPSESSASCFRCRSRSRCLAFVCFSVRSYFMVFSPRVSHRTFFPWVSPALISPWIAWGSRFRVSVRYWLPLPVIWAAASCDSSRRAANEKEREDHIASGVG